MKDKTNTPFWNWFSMYPMQVTVPKMYWDVKSQEQRILNLFELVGAVIEYAESIGENIEEYKEEVESLQAEFEQFKESGFEDYYEEQLNAWVDEHMPDIIARAIKMVFFGLTQDGYFVAYIPDSWNGIMFDTPQDYQNEFYGHLELLFDVEA